VTRTFLSLLFKQRDIWPVGLSKNVTVRSTGYQILRQSASAGVLPRSRWEA